MSLKRIKKYISKQKIVLLLIITIPAIFLMVISFHKDEATLINPDIKIGEEIIFKSGDITITGSLLKPYQENEKMPVIIGIVGSGAYSYRDNWENKSTFNLWRGISNIFIDKGFAVLLVEKRGINNAGGDWKKSSFYDRAKDVYSAVKYLQTRKDILPDKIGLVGHSQGGWIVQLVVSEHPEDIAFVINLAGPSVSVKEQILDDLRHDFKCQNFSQEEIKKKITLENFKLEAYSLISRIIKIGYVSRIINYDPNDILPKIQIPILSIYGENDYLTLANKNSRLLEEGLKKGGNENYKIIILSNTNHGFLFTEDICKKADTNDLIPELGETINNWDYLDTID